MIARDQMLKCIPFILISNSACFYAMDYFKNYLLTFVRKSV